MQTLCDAEGNSDPFIIASPVEYYIMCVYKKSDRKHRINRNKQRLHRCMNDKKRQFDYRPPVASLRMRRLHRCTRSRSIKIFDGPLWNANRSLKFYTSITLSPSYFVFY